MTTSPGGLPPAHELAERALAVARHGPLQVIIEDGESANVRFANNTTTTNGVMRARRVSVVAIDERSEGSAIGCVSRTGIVDIEELVALAEHKAGEAPLAMDEAPLVSSSPFGSDFADPPAETGLGVLAGPVRELGEAFGHAESEGHVLSGFAIHEADTSYLATSAGLRARHVQLGGTFELVARTATGASSWVGLSAPDPEALEVAKLHEQLKERLSWSKRQIELPPGHYEVVLPPDAVADLVIELAEAMSGRDAEDGSNVFAKPGGRTRLGEKVTRSPVDLYSDPGISELSAAPFVCTPASSADVSVFDNGSLIQRTNWLKGGTLEALRYHRAGAKRSGTAFAPPPENLVFELEAGSGNTEDLVRRTERGLLLTCLWYIREVDPANLLLTGLTRDGVFLVEHGEITASVNNFRFNESPLLLLDRVLDAGTPRPALSREWGEWMRLTRMAPLRVAEFNMSSASEAS